MSLSYSEGACEKMSREEDRKSQCILSPFLLDGLAFISEGQQRTKPDPALLVAEEGVT